MGYVLDRPAWHALTGPHAVLAEGKSHAFRYRQGTVLFAAARDDSKESLAALAALPKPGEVVALVEANELSLPPGLITVGTRPVVQLKLGQTPRLDPDTRIERLNWADASEMLALATLTEPGPFSLNALALGEFYGIRIHGRIIAMAGERMKTVGHTELSGVCTHPDFRRRGLARLLSTFVSNLIFARGETPFLHTWAENYPAIQLYESIGFTLRSKMNLAVLKKSD